MNRQIARRQFLAIGGGTALTASMASCDFFSTDPDADGSDNGGDTDESSRQAPALAERVEADELPPLGQRLPDEPLVVSPVEDAGRYGGEWRNALVGMGDAFRLSYLLGYENLVRWDPDWDEVVPNVASSFEAAPDGTRYTFELRPGMRWSDGEPFTADDIVFAYDDVLSHEEIAPVLSDVYLSHEGPATVERVDDHTVEFRFPAPNGLFLERLANEPSNLLTRVPRHHFERFHGDYGGDADGLADERGFASWVEQFQLLLDSGFWQADGAPYLFAWLPRNGLGDEQRVVLERNPYYFKTDPDGRQLPYIGTIAFEVVQDTEALLFMTLNGEVDLVDRHINTTQNKPVLARERDVADFDFFDLVSEKLNTMVISLNLTSTDEVKREIFQNRDFRVGLSHAIDRGEIIATVHAGQGEPWQAAPLRESEFLDEELATQYTAYDVDLANEFLDRAGHTERDADGLRLGPDGNPIRFDVDVGAGAGKPHLLDSLELVRGYWREVGIDMQPNSVDLTLFNERREANEADGSVWDGDGGIDVINAPMYYLPIATLGSSYAVLWAQWYASDGGSGERPPEPTRRQMRLYDDLETLVEPKERNAIMRRILAIAKDQFYTIGISTPVPGYGVVRNSFRNMPDTTYFAANFPYPGVNHPEQFFIERD